MYIDNEARQLLENQIKWADEERAKQETELAKIYWEGRLHGLSAFYFIVTQSPTERELATAIEVIAKKLSEHD